MKRVSVKVQCPSGLHLRVAGKVVEISRGFESAIMICKGCIHADTCSILELLLLNAPVGTELEVVAEGRDEELAADTVAEMLGI